MSTPAPSSLAPPRLRLAGITKRYPGVVANDGVTLDIQAGELLAVLGENGAGKSTLMKVIYGAVQPDAGTLALDGRAVAFATPAAARAAGIAMVFQHFALFDSLTVAENVLLGLPAGSTLATTRVRLAELAARYHLQIDAGQRVHDLSVGERQRVEILRALLTAPRLLILDEPTSVLTPQAIAGLFDTLRALAADGVSVVFISHKLDEIRRLTTRCVVMRAGRVVATVDPRAASEAELARLMIGADPPAIAAHATRAGAPALTVQRLTLKNGDRRHWLHDLHFTLHAGEILGLAGVSGNGQGALLAALAGETRTPAGTLLLFDDDIGALGPRPRRARGLRYVPEERLGHAAVPSLTLADNALLTADALVRRGWLDRAGARASAAAVIERHGVRAAGVQALAASLSGGNLQKFVVGREIDHAPRVLLVAQPTWGVDVGAAAAIRNALLALRAQGCAILLVSEELDELYALADRLMVIAKGRLSPAVPPAQLGIDALGRWMAGLWPQATASGAAAPLGADGPVAAPV